jgi:hypothetical protein
MVRKNFCGGGSRDGQRHMLLTLSSLLLYRGNNDYIFFLKILDKNWTDSPPKKNHVPEFFRVFFFLEILVENGRMIFGWISLMSLSI